MPLRIALAILAGAAVACDQRLTITPVNESFNNTKADDALNRATTALTTRDTSNDVACPVIFSRNGNVPTPVSGRNTIDTDGQLRDTFAKPGYVKVVHRLNRCGGQTNAAIIGCAKQDNMIVEDLTDNDDPGTGADLAGILWAHEFGHSQGLPHRDDRGPVSCPECGEGVCFDPCAFFPAPPNTLVMSPSIGTANLRINDNECRKFMEPQTAPIQISCTVCEGGLCYNQCNLGNFSQTDASAAPGAKVDIREFVRRIYPDSMPIDEMMQYGPEDVPALVAMLDDPRERGAWPMITSVLGVIGDDRAAEALMTFVTKPRSGFLRGGTRRSIGSGIVALGYLVERSGNRKALDFLIRGSEPAFWDAQPGMRWRSSTAPTRTARNRRMASFAVMGLGLSGHREAWEALQTRWDAMDRGADDAPADEVATMKELVEQSMGDHKRVSRVGLRGYYRN
jgi:hypothetical protein